MIFYQLVWSCLLVVFDVFWVCGDCGDWGIGSNSFAIGPIIIWVCWIVEVSVVAPIIPIINSFVYVVGFIIDNIVGEFVPYYYSIEFGSNSECVVL